MNTMNFVYDNERTVALALDDQKAVWNLMAQHWGRQRIFHLQRIFWNVTAELGFRSRSYGSS